MLTIKTSLRPSNVHGIGLFTEENIRNGSVIWRFDPQIDLYFDVADIENMSALRKEFIYHFSYLSTTSRKYILCVDDSRFMNHSSKKNNLNTVFRTGEPEGLSVASRDIIKGEELLIDYRFFDAWAEASDDEYLDF